MKTLILAALFCISLSQAMLESTENIDISWLQEKINNCRDNSYSYNDCLFVKMYIDKFLSPMCAVQPAIAGIAKREAICRLLYDAMADEKFVRKFLYL